MLTIDSILYADIGNSRIKLFKDGVKTAFHYKNINFTSSLVSFLTLERFNKIVYSSVSKNVENIFLNIVRNKKVFDFINVKELLSYQNIVDTSLVTGMGNDRILGIMGAIAYSEPPIITVDCGTAVTVNALDFKYSVLGGAIMAGAYTQKNSLGSISDALAPYKLNFSVNQIGSDTSNALSFGIVIGICGSIQKIIENITKEFHFENTSVYFTGGYGGKILDHLNDVYPTAIYDENLIFRGMAKLYENTRN